MRSGWLVAVLSAVAACSGCCTTHVGGPSVWPSGFETAGGAAEGCGRGLGWPRPLLHLLAGPLAPPHVVGPYQATYPPPPARFHPVPTGPVFDPASAAPAAWPGETPPAALEPIPARDALPPPQPQAPSPAAPLSASWRPSA